MIKDHGFFIRDYECLIDFDGLLKELSLIIEEDF